MTTRVASSISSITTAAVIFRFTRAPERRRAAMWISAALALAFFLNAPVRADQEASLAWNPVTTTPVSGYAFYVGNVSGVYTNRFDVGTNTEITLSGLKEGKTNYFAVVAYDSARLESPVSPSVPYIVPGLVCFTPPSKPNTGGTISFPVAAGHSYEIQASTDLGPWTNIGQTTVSSSNAWFYFQDPQTGRFTERFFRLIMN
jgi:hypothetical protein